MLYVTVGMTKWFVDLLFAVGNWTIRIYWSQFTYQIDPINEC